MLAALFKLRAKKTNKATFFYSGISTDFILRWLLPMVPLSNFKPLFECLNVFECRKPLCNDNEYIIKSTYRNLQNC